MSISPTSSKSNRIFVRCECHKVLAHRIQTADGWLIEAKYGKRIPTITSAYPMIITCSGKGCDFAHQVTPAEGITDTIREPYGRSVPTRPTGNTLSTGFAATG